MLVPMTITRSTLSLSCVRRRSKNSCGRPSPKNVMSGWKNISKDKLTNRKIGSYLHDSRLRNVICTIRVIIVITGLASFGLRGAIGTSFTLHARPGDLEFLYASLTFCNLLRSYLFKNFLTGNFETTLSTRCSCP